LCMPDVLYLAAFAGSMEGESADVRTSICHLPDTLAFGSAAGHCCACGQQ